VNLCRGCGQDFSAVKFFDRHRVGVHEFTYSEGAVMDPPREDGRRCLSIFELRGLGWEKGVNGRWFDPAERARSLRALGKTVEIGEVAA
jgi:hypothetical protein